jgi:hypothetical protein
MYIRRPGQLPIGQTAKARSGYRVQSLRRGRDRLESLQLIVKRGLAQPFQRTIPIFIVSITSKSLGLIWVRTPVLACQEAQPGVLAGRPRPLKLRFGKSFAAG